MKKYLGNNGTEKLMNLIHNRFKSIENDFAGVPIDKEEVYDMWGSTPSSGGSNSGDQPEEPNTEVAPIGAHLDWDYTLDEDNEYITITKYNAAEENITIYPSYKIDEKIYKTKITNSGSYSKSLFGNNKTIISIEIKEGIDYSEFDNMSYMFNNCTELTSIIFPEDFDTSNVMDMSYMFYQCNKLEILVFPEDFVTSNVTNMEDMFYGCKELTSEVLQPILNRFNTSKVTGDLRRSGFDLFYAGGMDNMFTMCESLRELDLSMFDFENVKSIKGMFSNCNKLSNIKFPSSKLNYIFNMISTFSDCYKLTELDLSMFDISQIRDVISTSTMFDKPFESVYQGMDEVFKNCINLKTVKVSKSHWVNTDCRKKDMFTGCGTQSVTYID